MGANFNVTSFPAMSKTELEVAFHDYVENQRDEFGSDAYSGTMANSRGLTISAKEFNTYEEAEDWLSDNTQKWGPAIAVKVGKFMPLFPVTKKDQLLQTNYNNTKEALENFEINIVTRTKNQKSAKKTCTHCGSSISIKHLELPKKWKVSTSKYDNIEPAYKFSGKYYLVNLRQLTDCPVCNHNLLLTDTDTKQKSMLEVKYKELAKKLADAKKVYEQKMKNKQGSWIVGALSAS